MFSLVHIQFIWRVCSVLALLLKADFGLKRLDLYTSIFSKYRSFRITDVTRFFLAKHLRTWCSSSSTSNNSFKSIILTTIVMCRWKFGNSLGLSWLLFEFKPLSPSNTQEWAVRKFIKLFKGHSTLIVRRIIVSSRVHVMCSLEGKGLPTACLVCLVNVVRHRK